jgi:mevalonate kinase
MSETGIVASAPAKVILVGGKSVNYGFPALAAAVEPRAYCTLRPLDRDQYAFVFNERVENGDIARLEAFRREIDALRAEKNYDAISKIACEDFFGPVRYVLSLVHERTGRMGYHLSWRSDIPAGSGLGSSAAASASMALVSCQASGCNPEPVDIAWLAWQGDIIAHGGMGTGLDTGASALGGIVRYSLKEGPKRIDSKMPLRLVIGDTLLRSSTARSNTSSRNWLEERPSRIHLMAEMGMLVEQAQGALTRGDMVALGHFMNLCHLIKEKLGMSLPKIETMVDAALEAGALGAKISGKGSGGIIVALAAPGNEEKIIAAINAAGGKGTIAKVGVEGGRIEDSMKPSGVDKDQPVNER